MLTQEKVKLAIVGLGYVGLPLPVEFGKKYPVVGFDINAKRVAELQSGQDHTLEFEPKELKEAEYLSYSNNFEALSTCNVFFVTVPTPIDEHNQPDLTPLIKAPETIGKVLKNGDIVIYESTVYPGATEEDCVPVLEKFSGLKFNQDFYAGYSPERINPGDKEHRVTTIKKVTAGSTPEAADLVDALYDEIITAGTHMAASIKVAEAAKVIENTQRDVNIALINELALISTRWASTPKPCCKRSVPSGTSCLSAPAWSAVTASASIPTTLPTKPNLSDTTRKSFSPGAGSMTAWAPTLFRNWSRP